MNKVFIYFSSSVNIAGEKCSSSDISIKDCKKCKRVPQSGPSCVVCRSNFHPGCVKQLKHVEIHKIIHLYLQKTVLRG